MKGSSIPKQPWRLTSPTEAKETGASLAVCFGQSLSLLTHKYTKHRNPIAGWTSQPGNDNQIWDFEEYSYTADELEGHIKSMPIKPGTNIASYTSPPDKKYLILPAELYQKIWSDAKIGDYQVRPAVFDCMSPFSVHVV
jgi:hypothetical protein